MVPHKFLLDFTKILRENQLETTPGPDGSVLTNIFVFNMNDAAKPEVSRMICTHFPPQKGQVKLEMTDLVCVAYDKAKQIFFSTTGARLAAPEVQTMLQIHIEASLPAILAEKQNDLAMFTTKLTTLEEYGKTIQQSGGQSHPDFLQHAHAYSSCKRAVQNCGKIVEKLLEVQLKVQQNQTPPKESKRSAEKSTGLLVWNGPSQGVTQEAKAHAEAPKPDVTEQAQASAATVAPQSNSVQRADANGLGPVADEIRLPQNLRLHKLKLENSLDAIQRSDGRFMTNLYVFQMSSAARPDVRRLISSNFLPTGYAEFIQEELVSVVFDTRPQNFIAPNGKSFSSTAVREILHTYIAASLTELIAEKKDKLEKLRKELQALEAPGKTDQGRAQIDMRALSAQKNASKTCRSNIETDERILQQLLTLQQSEVARESKAGRDANGQTEALVESKRRAENPPKLLLWSASSPCLTEYSEACAEAPKPGVSQAAAATATPQVDSVQRANANGLNPVSSVNATPVQDAVPPTSGRYQGEINPAVAMKCADLFLQLVIIKMNTPQEEVQSKKANEERDDLTSDGLASDDLASKDNGASAKP